MIARAAIVLAVVGCGTAEPPAASPAITSSAAARWVKARLPLGTPLLEAPARVVAGSTSRAIVTAPLRATIIALHAELGALRAANAAIVEIAMPDAAAAAAAYSAATGELAAHEQRAAQLAALRDEGLARSSDLAAVQLDIARLRGVRDIAATTLRAAGLREADASALAASGGRTTLRAPLTGVVVGLPAVIGASHAPGEPLAELATAQATRLEARLAQPLPEAARLAFVAVGHAPVAVELLRTAPVRESDGATRAWFALAEPVPAGATGRLRATLDDDAAALIPAAAIDDSGPAPLVWRHAGGSVHRVPVRVLASSGTDALVTGLAAGDEIASVAQAVPR